MLRTKSTNKLKMALIMTDFTFKMFFAVCVVSIGSGFQHGYNLFVLNHPSENIKNWINESFYIKHNVYIEESNLEDVWIRMINIYCFGGIVGGFLSGILRTYFGSKRALIFGCQILLVGICMQFTGKLEEYRCYELITLGRLLTGITAGINSGICTIYCCEISPLKLRGTMGSMYYLSTSISIFISLLLGRETNLGGQSYWILVIGGPPLFMSITQSLMLLMLLPESPMYFLTIGRASRAKKMLRWFRGRNADVENEFQILLTEIERVKILPDLKMHDFFVFNVFRKPILVIVALMLAEQFSGVYVVILSCNNLSKTQLGLSTSSVELINLSLSGVNVMGAAMSTYYVEKFGRKMLMIFSFGSMCIITVFLTVFLLLRNYGTWVVGTALILSHIYLLVFAFGAGNIPWFVASEISEVKTKPFAQSFGVATNWVAQYFIILLLNKVEEFATGYICLICMVFSALTCILVFYFFPETINSSVTENQKKLVNGYSGWNADDLEKIKSIARPISRITQR